MKKLWQVLGVAVLAVGLGATAHADKKKIELARYAKAFVGQGNVTVEIAPFKEGGKDGAILLFHGIESEWDGKAIKHEVVADSTGGQRYITKRDGKTWETLVEIKSINGSKRYELYVPGVHESISIAPSDGAAQLTTPQKIWQEYQVQLSAKK